MELLVDEHEDGVVVLTLNRPERRNALSPDLLSALCEAVEAAERSPRARVVLIRG